MGINKVNYGSTTLIDTSNVTVTADKLAEGYTALDNTGALITGTASIGGVNVRTLEKTLSSTATSITFTVEEEPKAFALFLKSLGSSSRFFVARVIYDGTETTGGYIRAGYLSSVSSGLNWSYSASNSRLTVTSTGSANNSPGAFYNSTYKLIYVY